jgi:Ca2+-transporting ATPase
MSNHKGLTKKEVVASRQKHGINVIPEKAGFLILNIILAQFKSPLVYIILIAGVISVVLKEYTDALLMVVLVMFNALMGFIQEYKAQKTLIALKKILTPETTVIRDGIIERIKINDVVIGDIVILNSGDKIPADGTLRKSVNLLINEAILTGESEAVLKSLNTSSRSVFMGTTVLSGHGIMVVEKIGSMTEMGEISQSISTIDEEETPLQLKIKKFSQSLMYIIVGTSIFTFLLGVATGHGILYMLEISTILAIAAIPEGLPIAITIILAIGMKRILGQNGLVKKLLAMETLGTTSMICVDKTGTITEGNMRVEKVEFKDKKEFFLGLSLANEQKNNVEVAIWNYLKKENFDADEVFTNKVTIYEEPFDSERKYRMVIVKIDDHEESFVLGAPEIILEMCKISAEEKKTITKRINRWAEEGLRVIGLISKDKHVLRAKGGFTWMGMVGIEDPIRAEAKGTIRRAINAGIGVKIITGDYRKTAEAIAMKIGFRLKPKNILEGEEMEQLTNEELASRIKDILLLTRITPRQKLRVINALQEQGEVVAMTGDGVNDAPALKKADIGIVVGSATEVAKESADLILLDSNFKTIISACEEGRLIFSNIKKVVAYVLSNSFVELFLILGAIIIDLPAPLTIVQILWLHLICDGPLDIALGFEKSRKTLEDDDPRKLRNKPILTTPMKALIFLISFTVGMVALLYFYYFFEKTHDVALAQTIAFATVGAVDIIYIFAFRDLSKPIFKIDGLLKNKFLIGSILLGAGMLLAGVYLPSLNHLLGTKPLPAVDWILVIIVGIIAIIWTELIKYIAHRKLRVK